VETGGRTGAIFDATTFDCLSDARTSGKESHRSDSDACDLHRVRTSTVESNVTICAWHRGPRGNYHPVATGISRDDSAMRK